MTNKHEIEIEGLPEGYEVSKVTVEEHGITRTWKEGKRMAVKAEIKLRKIRPRRIVMEKTGEEADINLEQEFPCGDTTIYLRSGKIWREVEE